MTPFKPHYYTKDYCMTRYLTKIIFFLCCQAVIAFANNQRDSLIAPVQTSSDADSADVVGTLNSESADSLMATPDTSSSRYKAANVGMDTTLFYDAKYIDVIVPERLTYLLNDAVVKYQNMTLKAGKITVDWNTNIITAEGIPDTVYVYNDDHTDSTAEIKWTGLPSLAEKGDVLNGFKLIYNFKTEKGRVIRGRTDFESGFYFGKQMKQIGKDVINISHGYFTSCDLEEDPHFHFQSRRIKVIVKDKVIAKPVIFYIRKIPVAIIPFAVFPHKQGRHSGIVIPSYGSSATEGNFIRGLGYYWAPNDYFDARGLIDYYDRSGWMLRGDMNYAKRYMLDGSISGSFTRKDFKTGRSERRWDLLVNHRQTIDPTMNLSVNGRFVSDNSYYKDFSSNMSERLNREIRSNATFSKRWPDKGLNLSANLSQTRDIESGRITQTLPQIRFTVSQRRFFEPNKDKKGRGSSGSDLRWYHSIYYNYSNQLYNQEVKDNEYGDRKTRYFDHNASISMNTPEKIFGWLTLGQSVSYNERWYDEYRKNTYDPVTKTVEVDTVSGFAALREFSYRLSSSTNIYGMFYPGVANITALRHVISPSISFNYRPDFSEQGWGNVDVFEDSLGVKQKYSRVLASVSSFSGAQRSISFSVRNLFQMKTGEDDKEKKFDLFSINSSTSYNLEAEQFKLSPLSSSFRSSIVKNLNFNMSFTHDFYKYDHELGQRVNKLMLFDSDSDWWKRNPVRMTSFRVSTSFRLQGKRGGQKTSDPEEDENVLMNDMGEIVTEDEYYDELYRASGSRFEESAAYSGLDIPWKANLALEYNLNKYNPMNPQKTFYLNLSGAEIQLTKNWKIRYNARYDIEKKELVNQSFTFLRDMHCWEARFVWRPSGIGAPYFYFKINVKSMQLRDLKWEKRGGRRSVFGY